MTLVITTASRFGISLVGDRAVSAKASDGAVSVLDKQATKVFHAPGANVGLAFWGMTELADGSDLGQFARDFIQKELTSPRPLGEIATVLADQLADAIRPLKVGSKTWADLRRGVHVSGFVDDLPYIYHVHMGTATHCKRPEAHEDYPTIHGGGLDKYRDFIQGGGFARLFNGYNELFDVVGRVSSDLRRHLEREFDVQIPAPTLGGQVAFERAIARLSAEMLLSADRVPAVGTEFDVIAFTPQGLASEKSLLPTGDRLKRRAELQGSDVTVGTSFGITLPAQLTLKTGSLDDSEGGRDR